MSASPVSGFAHGLTTVAPSEHPLEGDIRPPAPTPTPSAAVVVWNPPPEPGLWLQIKWALLGRPEPGLDGRFDHVLVDSSLISVPKDERLARQVLTLGKTNGLSVKNLFEVLAGDGSSGIKPKDVDAVRKDIRIAAERLEQRSPAAKLADAARLQLEVLRRELDHLDYLREDASRLQRRAEAGVPVLFARFDGQHVEMQTLLTGAANAVGGEQEKIELLRAGLASMVARRDATMPAIEQQLDGIRASEERRKQQDTQVSEAQARRAAVIKALPQADRDSYAERLQKAETVGARFFAPAGDRIAPSEVLAHLAWHGIEIALRGNSGFGIRALLTPPKDEPRQAIRDLTALEDALKTFGVSR